MPVQRFAPMTKDFATFDCDAHVTEPPWIWERARVPDQGRVGSAQGYHLVGRRDPAIDRQWQRGSGIGSPRRGGIPGTMRVITNAGPGVKHDIQRALNVRNLNPKTALTQEQVGLPGPRRLL